MEGKGKLRRGERGAVKVHSKVQSEDVSTFERGESKVWGIGELHAIRYTRSSM